MSIARDIDGAAWALTQISIAERTARHSDRQSQELADKLAAVRDVLIAAAERCIYLEGAVLRASAHAGLSMVPGDAA